MPALPTIVDLPDGVLASAQINAYLGAVAKFLMNTPGAQLYASSVQSINNNVMTTIVYQVATQDNVTGWTGGSGTGIYVCQYPGMYDVAGLIPWTSNATGARAAQFIVNGSLPTGQQPFYGPNNGAGTEGFVSAPTTKLRLAVGDQVAMQGLQVSGGALNTGLGAMMSISWRSTN